eukprot:scaffold148424_cov18-Tisochrysis_lutea.AAC.1
MNTVCLMLEAYWVSRYLNAQMWLLSPCMRGQSADRRLSGGCADCLVSPERSLVGRQQRRPALPYHYRDSLIVK